MKIIKKISEINLICGGGGSCQCLAEEEYEAGVGSHLASYQETAGKCEEYCCERIVNDIEGYVFTKLGKKYKVVKDRCD